MSRNRKLLYTPGYVEGFRNALRQARAELAQQHFHHLCELADVRKELDELRAQFDTLRSISLARSKAETKIEELRRLQAIGRARAAERDPASPLQ